MLKFEYELVSKEELATNITGSKEKFIIDFLNERGEKGEQVISIQEGHRPSTIAAVVANGQTGQYIPYYIVTLIVMREKKENMNAPDSAN